MFCFIINLHWRRPIVVLDESTLQGKSDVMLHMSMQLPLQSEYEYFFLFWPVGISPLLLLFEFTYILVLRCAPIISPRVSSTAQEHNRYCF